MEFIFNIKEYNQFSIDDEYRKKLWYFTKIVDQYEEKEDFYGLLKELEYIKIQITDKCMAVATQQDFMGNVYAKKHVLINEDANIVEKIVFKIDYAKKMIDLLEQPEQTSINTFVPTNKSRVKIDTIRVLNALYELKMFELPNGQIPTKNEFMKKTGDFLGLDLSNYENDLSQALNNTKIETNIKIFQEMTKITQDRSIK